MIKYVHTNIIARDWRKLADFYIKIFGCTEKPPQRDLAGEWLDRAASLKNAHLKGMHLRLPGYDSSGPTLEIFQYDESAPAEIRAANSEGFGHLAFAVDDVDACVTMILENGGSLCGEVVKTKVKGAGVLHFAYARDPEGNIIEIQKWG